VKRNPLIAAALLAFVFWLPACGDDDGDQPSASEGANTNAQSSEPPDTPDLRPFLLRAGEEPGFRPDGPVQTITGVEDFAAEFGLSEEDVRRLRSAGFISFAAQPLTGPQAAGISNLDLYATAQGAERTLAHELRPEVIRGFGPVENLRFFKVSEIPGARGWTGSLPGEPASHDVGNLLWVQGRCFLVLGNQGPGSHVGPLSEGAQAIYQRTNGDCP
jgi:hypothetical protein